MQQSDSSKKYQLFPREKRLPVLNSNKGLDSDKATAMAPAASSNEKTDFQTGLNGLKKRLNQHSLARRRKISVPEVGPMTTVQEMPMDSRKYHYLEFARLPVSGLTILQQQFLAVHLFTSVLSARLVTPAETTASQTPFFLLRAMMRALIPNCPRKGKLSRFHEPQPLLHQGT